MKLVVGLGNPEVKYNWTRHNTGFLALDFFFKLNHLDWGAKPRYGAIFGRTGDILFIKPQDYYNLSGEAVRKFMKFYKIPTSDILVICDDFNLEFGTLRYRQRGSAGGNNGLKSIIAEIGTEDFPRIRVGTGNNELRRRIGDVDFVLSKFTPEEKEKLPEILKNISNKIDEIISE
jgi:peptidyl-tRNA hydrolase, PTH1 family